MGNTLPSHFFSEAYDHFTFHTNLILSQFENGVTIASELYILGSNAIEESFATGLESVRESIVRLAADRYPEKIFTSFDISIHRPLSQTVHAMLYEPIETDLELPVERYLQSAREEGEVREFVVKAFIRFKAEALEPPA